MILAAVVCRAGRWRLVRWATLAPAVAAAALAWPPAGESAGPTTLYFLRGEQPVRVERPGSSVREAVQALLAGPTRAERRKRVTTQIPTGVALLGVRLDDGVATVDLEARFQEGADAAGRSARLAQLVLTVTGFPEVTRLRLLVEGGMPLERFPGYAVRSPLRRADIMAPPPPEPARVAAAPTAARILGVRSLQKQLVALGYLPRGSADGLFGRQTGTAVIAFQKWEGLARDGIPGPKTRGALRKAKRPTPQTRGSGRRIEILLDRQLALVVRGRRVERTIHVSTGAPDFATPAGSYSVFRKQRRSWSVPYKIWLPWASYFVGGIAFHQSALVPVRPASHGCVRVTRHDARWLFEQTPVHTKVEVLPRSRRK